MNTKQLKYVLAVSREGSFSKAAEVLNITQPSLSQYIKKLEKNVGRFIFIYRTWQSTVISSPASKAPTKSFPTLRT